MGERNNGGKGHQGKCIKDTWIKPKGVGSRVGGRDGWGWGEWWRENGDNYTWRTILKSEKIKSPIISSPNVHPGKGALCPTPYSDGCHIPWATFWDTIWAIWELNQHFAYLHEEDTRRIFLFVQKTSGTFWPAQTVVLLGFKPGKPKKVAPHPIVLWHLHST